MASPEQMRDLSVQFKNNAEDLQAFCRDLSSWTKEMDAADKQLLEAKARRRANQDAAPPVRNTTTPSSPSRKRKESDGQQGEVAAKKKEEVQQQPDSHRIRSYEFDRWDKFDVSKALEELDKDAEGDSDEDEDSDEDMNATRLLEQALVEKEKGNALFRQGQLDAAIEAYTRGMGCDTRNAVLPANRAMALIKKGLMAAAEADCSVAIDIDPTYAKAYYRRATARTNLGRVEKAIEDLEKVLELEPSNLQASAELEKRRSSTAKEPRLSAPSPQGPSEVDRPKMSFEQNLKGAFSSAAKTGSEAGVVEAVVKPPHARSQKPLRRVDIVEVGDVDEVAFREKVSLIVPGSKLESGPDNQDSSPLLVARETRRFKEQGNAEEVQVATKPKKLLIQEM